jgi:hypothetical protein
VLIFTLLRRDKDSDSLLGLTIWVTIIAKYIRCDCSDSAGFGLLPNADIPLETLKML